MAAAKLIVIYPTPKDVDAFERAYSAEHLPMASARCRTPSPSTVLIRRSAARGHYLRKRVRLA